MQNKRFRFSKALDRLEELVDQLSSEELELEEALNLFEEGIKLSVQCLKKLEEAKERVEFLIKESEEVFRRVEASPGEVGEIGARVADEMALDDSDYEPEDDEEE